jgi:uncharacterized protein
MNRHTLFLFFFIVSLLAGCQQKSAAIHQPPQVGGKNEQQIDKYKTPTIQDYQRLANTKSASQNYYRLLTAESLIRSGNAQEAKSYVDAIDLNRLNPQQRNKLQLLYAQINLSSGLAEQAVTHLDQVTPAQLNLADQITYHQSRAFAFSLSGELLKSARERIILSQLINPEEQYDNHAAILETLMLLPVETLQNQQPPRPDTLAGWMSLAIIFKQQNLSVAEFNNALSEWQYNYPLHPASSLFLENYLAKPQQTFKQPESIAILLPESGAYAQAALAIREGFMAAYHSQEYSTFKPEIRFYDSESADPATLYHQVITDGAELVIGPLNKKKISALVETTALNVPVLALNHVPGLTQENLYQFGLSPIDDVEQITSKAWFDGHQKALILTPNSKHGERIGRYFVESWQSIDGIVLEQQSYDPKQSDFSQPISKLLNLDESKRRYKNIRRIIPSIKFTPRRRQDVDVIFLQASPNTARLLNPQLRFYRASKVPVYATSHVYSGRHSASQDIDLNGITFCDIPWLFAEAYQGELSMSALQQYWKQFPRNYLRLFALGIDAYNIVPNLDKMDTSPFQGATGNLLLTRSKRIKRNLLCAKFSSGIPEVIGFTEIPSASYENLVAPDSDGPFVPVDDFFQDTVDDY